MRILMSLLLTCAIASANAATAPKDYVATHPDYDQQQKVTQAQTSAPKFFAQFQQLRKLLDQDRAELPEDDKPNEAQYWVCVRIHQLYTLFDNNRKYQAAFNQQYPDMDFQTLMGYWKADTQSERQKCYESEIFYSDRP